MIGNDSINFSLASIWRSWLAFRHGKRASAELDTFQYYLESHLRELSEDLNTRRYRHGGYRSMIVTDNKRRQIAVATIRDRVVHRLCYEYLVRRFDRTFIYDAWSCRKGKGVTAGIERTQRLLAKYPRSVVWRADVTKFFDTVDHAVLQELLERRVPDPKARWLFDEIVRSYATSEVRERPYGIPIGNLTSQIFANIYLNELDRFVSHGIRPLGYVRYGDDFIVIARNREEAASYQRRVTQFITTNLRLRLHSRNNVIVSARHGLTFLGVGIFPAGRRLNPRNWDRALERTDLLNHASYYGLVGGHMAVKYQKQYAWRLLEHMSRFRTVI